MQERKLALYGGTPVRKQAIPLHKAIIDDSDVAGVVGALRSTFVSGDGPSCRRFEKELREYLRVKHAFFTVSCTAALDLAFRAKDFPPGSEVIVPDYTFTSTALAPLLNNLKVVLVDVYPDNGNINVGLIEDAITDKTVAISPVDFAGNPADMDTIMAIAKKHGLYVVLDAAQSLGATYRGQKTGRMADVSCFSFHGTKNMTTGEGGALVTDDDAIAEKVMHMRDKGTNKHAFLSNPELKGFYEYASIGNSYVQSNILGALGSSQLAKLDGWNQRRRAIYKQYKDAFEKLPNVRVPGETAGAETNGHLFYILVESTDRDFFIKALAAEGVTASVNYMPLHLHDFYKSARTYLTKPAGSVQFYQSMVRLPIYPSLDDDEVGDVIAAVNKVAHRLLEA